MLHNFMKTLHLLGVDLIDCTVMTGRDKRKTDTIMRLIGFFEAEDYLMI